MVCVYGWGRDKRSSGGWRWKREKVMAWEVEINEDDIRSSQLLNSSHKNSKTRSQVNYDNRQKIDLVNNKYITFSQKCLPSSLFLIHL